MIVLLPPSEGKASSRRGRAMQLDELSFPGLTEARTQVMEALATASARDDALTVLGVGATLQHEVDANLNLASAPALPAAKLYTGVLFDALDLASLDAASRRRANQRLLVASAVHGMVRMTDRVSPYRCSMDVDLPGVGPLPAFWRPRLEQELAPALEGHLVVDCRSTSYRAALPPIPALADRWVLVDVPGASHWAKHTRGLVARRLCEVSRASRPEQLAELLPGTELVPPARTGKPWRALVPAGH